MRLEAEQHVNMSGGWGEPVYWEFPVIDRDTGLAVGFIRSETPPAVRHVSLFDSKYPVHQPKGVRCIHQGRRGRPKPYD